MCVCVCVCVSSDGSVHLYNVYAFTDFYTVSFESNDVFASLLSHFPEPPYILDLTTEQNVRPCEAEVIT